MAVRMLIALCLYVFLAWAFWTIWKELHQEGSALAARKTPSIRLIIRADNEIDSPKVFSSPEVYAGRAPDCDLVFDDPSVSAKHARFSYHHNHWWIEDLASTNGTLLNKTKLGVPAILVAGDEIECGSFLIIVEQSADTIE